MRFHKRFSRWVGAAPSGAIILGADAVPTTPPDPTADNQVSMLFRDINGWPVHRTAISYRGPALALNLTASLYLWDALTIGWYKLGPVPVGTLVPGQIVYFDFVSMIELAQTKVNAGNSVGNSADLALIVHAAGADPDGEYVFGIGGDLTTIGYA